MQAVRNQEIAAMYREGLSSSSGKKDTREKTENSEPKVSYSDYLIKRAESQPIKSQNE